MLRAYLDGEVHNSGGRKTTNTDSRNVLGDSGVLESSRVGTGGGGIDLSSQGAGTVLVNLMEGHGDGTIISSGGETLGGTLTSSSSNTSLVGTLGGLGSLSGSTAGGTASATSESIEKTALVVVTASTTGGSVTTSSTSATSSSGTTSGSASSTTHEGRDSGSSVNRTATLGTSKSRSLATHLLSADDGGIGLRAGEGVARVTGSTVDDRETGHGDTVGTLNLGDNTVGRNRAS